MSNTFEYKNKAEVLLNVCNESHTVYSNEVDVKKVIFRVIKTANKNCVFEGDEISYTVRICNDSCIDIDNPVFIDFLPTGLVLEPQTFKVNYVPKNPMYTPFDNRVFYPIDKIDAGKEAIITFTTKVL